MQYLWSKRPRKTCLQKNRTAFEKEAIFKASRWYVGIGDSVERIDSEVSSWLIQFICKFPWFFLPSRSNTSIKFYFVSISKSKLGLSLSPFICKVWSSLFKHYQDSWKLQIIIFLWYNELLEFKTPEAHIRSSNISLALLDPKKIDDKLNDNFATRHISQVLLSHYLCIFY